MTHTAQALAPEGDRETAQPPVTEGQWQTLCRLEDITPDAGVCAFFAGRQVAIFRTRPDDALFAIDNYDPIGEANVLSRGIIGSIGESVVVASPLYKQHFDLQTGQCLEDTSASVEVFQVRQKNGWVQLASKS